MSSCAVLLVAIGPVLRICLAGILIVSVTLTRACVGVVLELCCGCEGDLAITTLAAQINLFSIKPSRIHFGLL